MSNGSQVEIRRMTTVGTIVGRVLTLAMLIALVLPASNWACGCLHQDDLVLEKENEKEIKPDETNPLQRSGEIQKVAEAVKELVGLKWSGKQLELKFPTDPQHASTQFNMIRQLSGFGGGGSSWGGDVFEFNASSPKLQTRMAREKRGRTDFQSIFFTQEKSTPNRRLDVVAEDDGYLQITINDRELGYLLRVRQLANGEFSVQELNGVAVFAAVGPTFESVCRQEREFMESRLIPAISHFGLGTLATPYSEEVQKQVVSIIGPWSEAEKQVVEGLTANLESESFEARQEASKRLKDASAEDRLLLSRVINDSRFSPEVRTRVRSLVREKASEEELVQMEFMDQLVRRLDADYVRELIDLQTDPASREILVAHLNSMTDGEVGVKSQGGVGASNGSMPPKIIAAAPDLLAEQGALQTVAAETAALLHLIWNGDQISVDRPHWAEPFGGKSIKELADEVQSAIETAHLPEKWFHAGGSFDVDSVSHPQVLFERLEARVVDKSDMNNNRHVYYGRQNASLNRDLKTTLLTGRLQFEDNDNRHVNQNRGGNAKTLSVEKEPFLLTLSETTSAGRALTVQEPTPGELHILLTGEESNFVIQLVIDKNRALVQDVRGEVVKAFTAPNFRQLLDENRDYFEQEFFPLVRHLGISVDPAIVPLPKTVQTQPSAED